MKLEDVGPDIYFVFTIAPKEVCSKKIDGSVIFHRTCYYNEMSINRSQYFLLSTRDIILVKVIEI